MRGAWSYSKYPLLKSKQEMEAGKDHIGTRQDPAALCGPNRQRREEWWYIVLLLIIQIAMIISECISRFIHSRRPWEQAEGGSKIELLIILSDDMEQAVTRE